MSLNLTAATKLKIMRPSPKPGSPLSEREKTVCDLLLAGLSCKEIAVKIGISPKTVATFKFQIFAKTGTVNDVQLGQWLEKERFGRTPASFSVDELAMAVRSHRLEFDRFRTFVDKLDIEGIVRGKSFWIYADEILYDSFNDLVNKAVSRTDSTLTE